MSEQSDGRQVVRFIVDALVTPEQVALVETLLGTALCGAPDEHSGPCRIAWRLIHRTEGQPSVDGLLDPVDVADVRRALGCLEAVPPQLATAALRAELLAAPVRDVAAVGPSAQVPQLP